jgi:hypothetical protein
MSTNDQLITDLTAALTQVITDEGVLQSAITAVQGVVTTPTVDANDALVTAVVAAFTSAGYTVTAPVAPAAPATDATTTPTVPDTGVTPTATPELPATDATPTV